VLDKLPPNAMIQFVKQLLEAGAKADQYCDTKYNFLTVSAMFLAFSNILSVNDIGRDFMFFLTLVIPTRTCFLAIIRVI